LNVGGAIGRHMSLDGVEVLVEVPVVECKTTMQLWPNQTYSRG
jgi:hypothetical protein